MWYVKLYSYVSVVIVIMMMIIIIIIIIIVIMIIVIIIIIVIIMIVIIIIIIVIIMITLSIYLLRVAHYSKAHHTLADFLSETNLSGFLAHHTLANFLSTIFCRVNTLCMLDSGSKYHVMEITLFHWLQHIFVSDKLSGTTTH